MGVFRSVGPWMFTWGLEIDFFGGALKEEREKKFSRAELLSLDRVGLMGVRRLPGSPLND